MPALFCSTIVVQRPLLAFRTMRLQPVSLEVHIPLPSVEDPKPSRGEVLGNREGHYPWWLSFQPGARRAWVVQVVRLALGSQEGGT